MTQATFGGPDLGTKGPLCETITEDGKYRYRLYEGSVVAIQKPDETAEDGWSTAYVFRENVCPCTGHQYRGNCQHKPISLNLIAWWAQRQAPPAPVVPAST